MKDKKVNFAIQVLPESKIKYPYDIVDDAIKVIAKSGFTYKVCPFETVVECTLKEGLDLIKTIQERCNKSGADKMMTYIKIQSDFTEDITIEDKMHKYNESCIG